MSSTAGSLQLPQTKRPAMKVLYLKEVHSSFFSYWPPTRDGFWKNWIQKHDLKAKALLCHPVPQFYINFFFFFFKYLGFDLRTAASNNSRLEM